MNRGPAEGVGRRNGENSVTSHFIVALHLPPVLPAVCDQAEPFVFRKAHISLLHRPAARAGVVGAKGLGLVSADGNDLVIIQAAGTLAVGWEYRVGGPCADTAGVVPVFQVASVASDEIDGSVFILLPSEHYLELAMAAEQATKFF